VLFIDLDGTVIRNPFETGVLPHIAKEIAGRAAEETAVIVRQFYVENARRIALGTDAAWAYDWDDIVKTVAADLRVAYSFSVEALVRKYAHRPHISVLNRAKWGLAKLRQGDRLLVAATNGLSRYQLPVLRALRLDGLFDAFLSPDITNALKGDLRFYSGFLTYARLAVSIGDSYRYDVEGPSKLGMRTIWLDRQLSAGVRSRSPLERPEAHEALRDKPIRPNAIIRSFTELPSLVDLFEEQQSEANNVT
jgi:FMN phosphatase YigB (HAD superfamily)